MLRTFRRHVTASLSNAALRAAPLVPESLVQAAQGVISGVGARSPMLARLVADNMRAVGLYSPEVHRDYFRRVAEHLAAAMHIFRHVPPADTPAGRPMAAGLARVVHQQIKLGDSVEVLRRALEGGQGAIIVGAHVTNFLLILARLNEEIPLTVYLRHSRDPRKLEAKQRWCRATGLSFIAEPASSADPTRRAATLADALAAGRVLVITPDLPQKDGDGVAVRFLDRIVHFPNGPAAMSLLTGAPLVSATGRPEGRATRLVLEGPLSAEVSAKGRGWRQAAIAERMQWFADRFAAYLQANPSLWFLWADNRWTRVFRGDPRFATPIDASSTSARATRVAEAV